MFSAWQTGGAGAGTLLGPTAVWPPTSLPGVGVVAPTALPSYTATGPAITLPPIANNPSSVTGNDNPYYTASPTASVVDGWANAQDTLGQSVEVAGCEDAYPDEYDGGDVIPAAWTACQAAARKRDLEPRVTPPPVLR